MSSKVVVRTSSPQFRDRVAGVLDTAPNQIPLIPPDIPLLDFLAQENIVSGVVVLAPEMAEDDAIATTEAVMREVPATAVVLVRNHSLNGTLSAAMRAGVRDVVDLSKGDEDLRDALGRAVSWVNGVSGNSTQDGAEGSIVQIFSSKGGTGKTFLACNLAGAIAAAGDQDVAVVDLDLGLGDVYSYFGSDPSKENDLISVADAHSQTDVRSLGTKVGEHLYLYGVPSDPTATMSSETTAAILRALRSTFPSVVVDSPADYSDRVLTALEMSNEVVMVASLDVVSLKHLSIAVSTLRKLGVQRSSMRFVLNRSDSKVGLESRDVEKVLNVEIDTMIPSSSLVPTSLNSGELVVAAHPRSDVAKAIRSIAKHLAPSKSISKSAGENGRRRLFSRR